MNEVLSKELWDSLRATSRNTETGMDPLRRKRTGSYYTDLDLTDVMMQELVDTLDTTKKKIIDYTFFDESVTEMIRCAFRHSVKVYQIQSRYLPSDTEGCAEGFIFCPQTAVMPA